MRLHISIYLLAFVISCSFFIMHAARADTVHISMSGPEFLTLSEDAASVIVGNPAFVGVIVDNPRHIMLMPKAPGMTNVIVLGSSGKVIFDGAVIVGGPRDRYIRIENACVNGGKDCQPMKTYYCDEGHRCQDVGNDTVVGGSNRSSGGTAAAGRSSVDGASAYDFGEGGEIAR